MSNSQNLASKNMAQPQSPITPNSQNLTDSSQPQNSIIMVRDVVNSHKKNCLHSFFSQFGTIKRMVNKPTTNHYYIEFDEVKPVTKIEEKLQTTGLSLEGKDLEIIRINKIPLDLNEPSKVILITFMNFGEKIDLSLIVKLLDGFGVIQKVVIINKKKYESSC